MKKRSIAFLLAATLFLLTGCRPSQKEHIAAKMVTQITITCETCADFTRRYYNTNEKMQLILLYIRDLGPKFKPKEDPDSVYGRTICITMTCADGSSKIYRQKGNQYFQAGTQPWQSINMERGNDLWRIVLYTPSDPEPESLMHPSLPRQLRPILSRKEKNTPVAHCKTSLQ